MDRFIDKPIKVVVPLSQVPDGRTIFTRTRQVEGVVQRRIWINGEEGLKTQTIDAAAGTVFVVFGSGRIKAFPEAFEVLMLWDAEALASAIEEECMERDSK